MFLAEVSTASTSLGIELGWVDEFGVPIIFMYAAGTTPTGSIRAVSDNVNEYETPRELVGVIENELGGSQL